MKVQVINEQGIDEAGNKHPAPGIADGTHECVDGWEHKNYLRYGDQNWHYLGKHVPMGYENPVRQIWVLAEQQEVSYPKSEVRLIATRFSRHSRLANDTTNNDTLKTFDKWFKTENFVHNTVSGLESAKLKEEADTSSTRIAELEARVAELEGVLKQMGEVDIEIITKIYDRATNALKNQQP